MERLFRESELSILEITPTITEKVAYNFTGLCLNCIDLLTTQKRALLCKPKRERTRPFSYTNPEHFLSNIKRLLPPIKLKQIESSFPQAAILRRKEVSDVVGENPELRWFDFGILSRHNINPHRGESTLIHVYHAYFILASHPTNPNLEAVEIIDVVADNHHLLVNEDKKSQNTFSSAIIYYLVNEEVIPRLMSSQKENKDLEGMVTTFGVFTTAVQDYDVRAQIVALPPL